MNNELETGTPGMHNKFAPRIKHQLRHTFVMCIKNMFISEFNYANITHSDDAE